MCFGAFPGPWAATDCRVAERARTVSMGLSRAIYEDAIRAFEDAAHPCHAFRRLQDGVPDDRWQMPEPFNGRTADAGIVFLGLNPSYDPREAVPTIGSSFEEWDCSHRARFDSAEPGWHKLYRRYQAVGEMAVGSEFRLGRDAVVLEAIHFRSAAGQGCNDRRVLEHELRSPDACSRRSSHRSWSPMAATRCGHCRCSSRRCSASCRWGKRECSRWSTVDST
jgi:hypothetical protein